MDPQRPDGLDLDIAFANGVDPETAAALVARLREQGAAVASEASSTLHVSDPLTRHVARRAGCTGGLRAPLVIPGAGDAAAVGAVDARDLDDLAAGVGVFLEPRRVERRRGFTRGYDLRATTADGIRLSVRVPRDCELMPEPMAAALDTALAVRSRFGRAAAGINALSFDHGGEALARGAVSGIAEGGAGVVVLSPLFVGVEPLVQERRTRLAAGNGGRPAPGRARPFADLDAVVAHECWHYLDAEIRVSGSAYVAFNAELGDALGVASLELALRGDERDAPAEWRDARARLVQDVSAYAATSPREASAEMFAHWWCAHGPVPPVIARFGELVERFFPLDAVH